VRLREVPCPPLLTRGWITSVIIHRIGEGAPISDGLRCFAKQGVLSRVDNSGYRLELEWENGRTGQLHEFAMKSA